MCICGKLRIAKMCLLLGFQTMRIIRSRKPLMASRDQTVYSSKSLTTFGDLLVQLALRLQHASTLAPGRWPEPSFVSSNCACGASRGWSPTAECAWNELDRLYVRGFYLIFPSFPCRDLLTPYTTVYMYMHVYVDVHLYVDVNLYADIPLRVLDYLTSR